VNKQTWRPSPACPCGQPIPVDGPSPDYCTPECQTRWLQTGHDYLPIPARPEWRMGASESDWRRSMAWPDVPALPPQDVAQWIEDTDPDPVPGGSDRLPNSSYNRKA
jgi:hypothetical protein